MHRLVSFCGFLLLTLGSASVGVALAQAPRAQKETWEQVLAAGRKEGKVVVSFPASAELRRDSEPAFKARTGIELELYVERGARSVRRIFEEGQAGVRTIDLHVGGTNSVIQGLLPHGILDPVEPWMMLPEVRDPKNWWGGHLWVDKAKRFIYGYQAYLTEGIWYNTTLMKPEEITAYDDLLNPKLKGKIGFLDPRTPGAGDSTWAYMWKVKGEDYLKRLVAQKLYLSPDQRLLADNVAKGSLAVVIGLTHYTFLPFIKAGLPVKPAPTPKEGAYGTGGSGNLVVVKNPPHPNATKVFVNWLLGKEGQEVWVKAMGQGTRRLDVETKYLQEFGVIAAKDIPGMTVEKFNEVDNQSEEKIETVREPANKIARKLLD